MTDLHILRVFCGPGGRHGNRLGIVLDGLAVATGQDRQAMAARLGFSETVFVDDVGAGVMLLTDAGLIVATRKKGWVFYRRDEQACAALRADLETYL